MKMKFKTPNRLKLFAKKKQCKTDEDDLSWQNIVKNQDKITHLT